MTARGLDTKAEQDVLLGYAPMHDGSVAACFMDSVLGVFAFDAMTQRPRLREFHSAGGPYIHDNKARIARYFMECTDKQWLWMCDADMKFPSDTLTRMLAAAEEHDCRVLGALYWNQYEKRVGRCVSWLTLDREFGMRAVPYEPKERHPVEVSAVGMGCTIIHRDVIEDVADMYPLDPWNTFGADLFLRFTDGDALIARSPSELPWEKLREDGKEFEEGPLNPVRLGEDVTFCLRARKAGWRVFGLPTVMADHFKVHMMTPGPSEAEYLEAHAEAVASR